MASNHSFCVGSISFTVQFTDDDGHHLLQTLILGILIAPDHNVGRILLGEIALLVVFHDPFS